MDQNMKATKTEPLDHDMMRVDVIQCSRCGKDHTGIIFNVFLQPPKTNDDVDWDWWGTCPNTGDPILMTTTEAFGATNQKEG